MRWVIWAILLILQNGGHALVNRGRNSNSLLYNALASLFSNSIWIMSSFFTVDNLMKIIASKDLGFAAFVALFYGVFAATGSVLAHWIAMRFLEPARGWR